jgi:hypothetical protein
MLIGVVMQRLPLQNNRWQSHQWRPLEIVGADVLSDAGDGAPRCLRNDPDDLRWLFSGFEVLLHRDEGEGYFLNLQAPAPSWFVMWRMEQVGDTEIAVPKFVTLSYNEAARLMDGGEQVDRMEASDDVIANLVEFVATHYQPEIKIKRKKPSFEGGAGVDKMARAEGQGGDSNGSK